MKKALVCYPGGKKTTIEITDLHDIFQKDGLTIKELQGIAHDYVLVVVECATESEHEVYFVYVVPVEMESGKAWISAEKIRRTIHEVFDMDVGSLHPCQRSRPGTQQHGECDSNRFPNQYKLLFIASHACPGCRPHHVGHNFYYPCLTFQF